MSGALDLRPEDHVYGDPGAPVTVLEYGDYECPYCGAAAPVLKALVDGSDGGVRLVFRHWPLADVHPYALTAALAAEAAGGQGAYWEMHELLFGNQDHLADVDLAGYATQLGLDGSRVVGDAAQPFGAKVVADFETGVELEVPGTPTLFIDGQLFNGRPDLTSLRRAIGAAGQGSSSPGSAADAGLDPGERGKRRWLVGRRRAQREPLAQDAQQDGAQDRCGQ